MSRQCAGYVQKILVIADIHGNFAGEKIQRILEEREISEIFILGDFAKHGCIGCLENVENFLNTLALHRKIYAIPGNCDGREILRIFEKFNGNEHNKVGRVDEITNTDFIFFGGSNITPFNSIFEYSEDEIYENLKKLFEGAKSERKILLTHCPPYNTNCDFAIGRHAGSTAIRRVIEEFQPEINFCSHVHQCYGKEDFIGKTRIVNVGELKRGCAILKFEDGNFETERINFNL
ncbi:MAG: YfcE family phosphodiesterase [Candidatus Altiarchaeales archaeon HGW-Altiarchaeales-1]|nr:MAG: YfcE family phosphodiesterase [Candidatus Altiarchaeales archaeon HGW-Altiarchaeales-1]